MHRVSLTVWPAHRMCDVLRLARVRTERTTCLLCLSVLLAIHRSQAESKQLHCAYKPGPWSTRTHPQLGPHSSMQLTGLQTLCGSHRPASSVSVDDGGTGKASYRWWDTLPEQGRTATLAMSLPNEVLQVR